MAAPASHEAGTLSPLCEPKEPQQGGACLIQSYLLLLLTTCATFGTAPGDETTRVLHKFGHKQKLRMTVLKNANREKVKHLNSSFFFFFFNFAPCGSGEKCTVKDTTLD